MTQRLSVSPAQRSEIAMQAIRVVELIMDARFKGHDVRERIGLALEDARAAVKRAVKDDAP